MAPTQSSAPQGLADLQELCHRMEEPDLTCVFAQKTDIENASAKTVFAREKGFWLQITCPDQGTLDGRKLFLTISKQQDARQFLAGRLVVSSKSSFLRLSHVGKTIATVDWAIAFGLKRHFCLLATVGAVGSKVLPGTTGSCFAVGTARLTTLRLILEAALGVEFLLTGRKLELLIALFTYYRSVFVHVLHPHFS